MTVVKNINGKLVNEDYQSASNAKEPFSGSVNKDHTFTKAMTGFVISNDGASNLTFTINSYTFTLKPGEIFDECFEPFTQVSITTSVAYRAWGRG